MDRPLLTDPPGPHPDERCSAGTCQTRSWFDARAAYMVWQHGADPEAALRISFWEAFHAPSTEDLHARVLAWEREAHEYQRRAEEDAADAAP